MKAAGFLYSAILICDVEMSWNRHRTRFRFVAVVVAVRSLLNRKRLDSYWPKSEAAPSAATPRAPHARRFHLLCSA